MAAQKVIHLGYGVLLSYLLPIPQSAAGIELLPSRKSQRGERVGRRHSQLYAQGLQMPALRQGMRQHLNWKEARQKTGHFPRGVFGRDGLFERSSLWGQNLTCLGEFEGKMVILRGSKGKEKD